MGMTIFKVELDKNFPPIVNEMANPSPGYYTLGALGE